VFHPQLFPLVGYGPKSTVRCSWRKPFEDFDLIGKAQRGTANTRVEFLGALLQMRKLVSCQVHEIIKKLVDALEIKLFVVKHLTHTLLLFTCLVRDFFLLTDGASC
jgi:hypothetical protein